MFLWKNGFLVWEADKGTEGAATEADKGTGDEPGQQTEKPFKAFASEAEYQAHINATVQERVRRAEESAKTKAEREAEEKTRTTLAEQQKFKELADTETARAGKLQAELDTVKPTFERYEKALQAYLDKELANIPAHLKPLVEPALAKLDVADQLLYLAENAKHFETVKATDGVPGTPKRTATPDVRSEEATKRAERQVRNKF